MPALFVTGTGTGVGKTIVAASLARAFRERGIDVGVCKPFASGAVPGCDWRDDDALLLKEAAGCSDPLSEISPQRFAAPLAPLSAARLEARIVDVEAALRSAREVIGRHRVTIIEGVGGIAVPLTENVLVSDFARELGVPVLIVASSALGTINHSLLTIEHLRARKVEISGIIFVRGNNGALSLAETTGPDVVVELGGVESFGIVPFCGDLNNAQTAAEAASGLPWDCAAIRLLAS